MKCNQFQVLSWCAMLALLTIAVPVCADEDQAATTERIVGDGQTISVVASSSKYWIGVYAVPAEAALKSHLGLEEDCVIVRQVMEEGPAKKAGVQVHDVLLQLGDTSIGSVNDLMKAVDKSEGQEVSLSLIRGGKKKSLKLSAEVRPEKGVEIRWEAADSEEGRAPDAVQWLQALDFYKQAENPFRFRVVGPGVVERGIKVDGLHAPQRRKAAKMPKNLSIQINKTGDAPAKIKVTRDSETWEVTEDSLDELPADVRSHVTRSLGGHSGVAFGFGPDGRRVQLKSLQVYPGTRVNPPVVQLRDPLPAVRGEYRIRREISEKVDDAKRLRQDLEDLKAAVKKLQEAQSGAEKPGDRKLGDQKPVEGQ